MPTQSSRVKRGARSGLHPAGVDVGGEALHARPASPRWPAPQLGARRPRRGPQPVVAHHPLLVGVGDGARLERRHGGEGLPERRRPAGPGRPRPAPSGWRRARTPSAGRSQRKRRKRSQCSEPVMARSLGPDPRRREEPIGAVPVGEGAQEERPAPAPRPAPPGPPGASPARPPRRPAPPPRSPRAGRCRWRRPAGRPAARAVAASRSSESWSGGSAAKPAGSIRQRRSGPRRSGPSSEQGASTSAPSTCERGRRAGPEPLHDAAGAGPRRPLREPPQPLLVDVAGQHPPGRPDRGGQRQRLAARPGAAVEHPVPRPAPSASASSWLPSSCTSQRPSRQAARPRTLARGEVTTRPSGASAEGRVATPSAASAAASAARSPRSRLARSATGPGRLSASASAAGLGAGRAGELRRQPVGERGPVGQRRPAAGRGGGRAAAGRPASSAASPRPARSRSSSASRRRGEPGAPPRAWRSRRRQSPTPKTASAQAARPRASRPRWARRNRSRRRSAGGAGEHLGQHRLQLGGQPGQGLEGHLAQPGLRRHPGGAPATVATAARSWAGVKGFSSRAFGTLLEELGGLPREGAAGEEDHPGGLRRGLRQQPLVELHAGHLRHHQVAEDGVEAPGGEQRQGLGRAADAGHPVRRRPASG